MERIADAARQGQTHVVEALLSRETPKGARASAAVALAAAQAAGRRDTAGYLSDVLAAEPDDFAGGGGGAKSPEKPPANAVVQFRVADPELDPDSYGGINRPAETVSLSTPVRSLEGAGEKVFPERFNLALVGAVSAKATVITDGTRGAAFRAIVDAAVRGLARGSAEDSGAELTISGAERMPGGWRVHVASDPGYAGGVDDEGSGGGKPGESALPFPFKRRFLPDDAAVYFSRLRANSYSRVERAAYARGHRGRRYPPARKLRWQYGCGPRKSQTAIVINERAYDEVDVITDLFTEPARMAAAVEGKPSPLAVWADPLAREEILAKSRTLDLAPLAEDMSDEAMALRAQREAIWHTTPEATSFKVSLAKAIYEFFRARRTLDPCAGWGDRMLGAAGAGLGRYVGLDPNPALAKGHAAIAEFVAAETAGGAGTGTAATVRPIPAEDYTAEMAAEDFGGALPDFVFTSPPFFTYEIYNAADENQSVSRHATLEDWVHGWLLPVMGRAWGFLAPGGHFAIYIADAGGHDVVAPLVAHMSALGTYCGVVACRRGKKRPVPLFVWRKER